MILKKRITHPTPDAVARLIRSRRTELDWSLASLARAAGLHSPAYIFHIENGSKMPSEGVARRIASALGLDPELLAAWARARGRADLHTALEASDTMRRWLGDPSESTAATRAPAPPDRACDAEVARTAPELQGRGDAAADVAARLDSVDVPVLTEGEDPEAGSMRAIETLRLARALFPPLDPGARLIAYRLSAHGARRIPETLRPGDCVVVRLDADPPGPDAPCAVRLGGRVEIARARVRDGMVYLPPPGGADDGERPNPSGGAAERPTIVGHVVLAVRRWL